MGIFLNFLFVNISNQYVPELFAIISRRSKYPSHKHLSLRIHYAPDDGTYPSQTLLHALNTLQCQMSINGWQMKTRILLISQTSSYIYIYIYMCSPKLQRQFKLIIMNLQEYCYRISFHEVFLEKTQLFHIPKIQDTVPQPSDSAHKNSVKDHMSVNLW